MEKHIKKERVPRGPTCYAGGRQCFNMGMHPLTGKRCCTCHGNTQLDDVFKCPACLEEAGQPENITELVRWRRD